jgi:hypothetical protein
MSTQSRYYKRPGGHQSHRRRERAGISDGNKRLSKKISGERKVIKMEREEFGYIRRSLMENKLKEALKKLGIETVEQLNAAIKTEKPLDIGIMTSEVAKEQKAAS